MHVPLLKYQIAGAVQLTADQHIPGLCRAAAMLIEAAQAADPD